MEGSPWGGSEYLWAGAAEKLARRGIEVVVSVKDWGAPVKQVERLRAAGCRVFTRPAPSLLRRAFRKLPPWRDYIRRHVAEIAARAQLIVISQGSNKEALEWAEAARAGHHRYATIAQGAVEFWWPDDDLADRLAASQENAARTYFVSQAVLDLSRRQFGTPLGNSKVVRNAFNVRYEARPPWPDGVEQRLAFASVGRLDIICKAQDVLLQVLALPHWRARNVSLSLIGHGPNERGLRRLAEQLRLTKVAFEGESANIEQVWAAHHALVLPSRSEGMPLVVTEAMLCARPCVATDVGGVRELVRDNVNGFLAKASTVELLDEAMNRAWEERHRLREMGEQAAIDVRKFVGPDPLEDFASELLALMDQAAGAVKDSRPQTSRAASPAEDVRS